MMPNAVDIEDLLAAADLDITEVRTAGEALAFTSSSISTASSSTPDLEGSGPLQLVEEIQNQVQSEYTARSSC